MNYFMKLGFSLVLFMSQFILGETSLRGSAYDILILPAYQCVSDRGKHIVIVNVGTIAMPIYSLWVT